MLMKVLRLASVSFCLFFFSHLSTESLYEAQEKLVVSTFEIKLEVLKDYKSLNGKH